MNSSRFFRLLRWWKTGPAVVTATELVLIPLPQATGRRARTSTSAHRHPATQGLLASTCAWQPPNAPAASGCRGGSLLSPAPDVDVPGCFRLMCTCCATVAPSTAADGCVLISRRYAPLPPAQTPGGFSCGACLAGLRGSALGPAGCLPPAASCAASNGNCALHSACADTPGGPVCGACAPGYVGTGDTQCVDSDGCSPANNPPQRNSSTPCARGVRCADVPAAEDPTGRRFVCGACPPGRVGDGLRCDACSIRAQISATSAGAPPLPRARSFSTVGPGGRGNRLREAHHSPHS